MVRPRAWEPSPSRKMKNLPSEYIINVAIKTEHFSKDVETGRSRNYRLRQFEAFNKDLEALQTKIKNNISIKWTRVKCVSDESTF
ncbi:hypothetical protein GWI33_023389 [Rhynchophorus ferrugineus]|uniref:Uncharacterized protein n=1 Tax=Rhynchophorus ferrugineus TaxID=354439 RepID=A0A834M2E9_RHYFE|nr:hypothetical protein GWI33_023389 [Rhynchophorus ferrugineus]